MNKVFHDYLDKFMVIYLDYIVLGLSKSGQHRRMSVNFTHFWDWPTIIGDLWKGTHRIIAFTELLKKEHKWCWTSECQKAFEGLKEAMMKDPALALYDIDKSFEVQMDTTNFTIK
ncbi:uncharacterized protein LOC111281521 [Durio zibethinus]|uniref:Uncharacterized protein LOC111281521 n=1 Tax=Durio zibethinus TaxID=66656 RepID=A0A6P5X9R6_DURZI|nr:uncharacterized protein LOC111281521 [Durio zibethinus]